MSVTEQNAAIIIFNFLPAFSHWSDWKYISWQKSDARLRDKRINAIIIIRHVMIWINLNRCKEHDCFLGCFINEIR